MVTANLLGLPFLGQRFEMLHAAYMLRLEEARTDDLLRLALRPGFPPASFGSYFQRSPCFDRWKPTRAPTSKDARKSLERFLLYYREDLVVETAKSRHLTAVIPFGARLQNSFRFADLTLEAPLYLQDTFFRYRRGLWQIHQVHQCRFVPKGREFHRGDEECGCFQPRSRLSRKHRQQKRREGDLLGLKMRYTNVDFLLNHREFKRAGRILRDVQDQLVKRYSNRKDK